MKKLILLKNLILVTMVLLSPVKAFGYAEAELPATLAVQPTVSISKSVLSDESASVIDVERGKQDGMQAVFDIITNVNDSQYKFIVGAKAITATGEVSGFANNGGLIFTNITNPPTESAFYDAKALGSNNPNVIVYPVTMTITSPMTVNYGTSEDNAYKDCYVVLVNNAEEGTLTQTVSDYPTESTYSYTQDQAGSYQATVYFTAIGQ